MKKIILAACLAVGLASGVQAKTSAHQIVTTKAFITACTNSNDAADKAFCNGFAQGVYDTYVMSRHEKRSPDFICLGDNRPTRQQSVNDFVKWNEQNPQYLERSAADTLLRYLATVYPCKR